MRNPVIIQKNTSLCRNHLLSKQLEEPWSIQNVINKPSNSIYASSQRKFTLQKLLAYDAEDAHKKVLSINKYLNNEVKLLPIIGSTLILALQA